MWGKGLMSQYPAKGTNLHVPPWKSQISLHISNTPFRNVAVHKQTGGFYAPPKLILKIHIIFHNGSQTLQHAQLIMLISN